MKTTLAILFIAGFAVSGHCGRFTPEEQALLQKHLVMEVYRPNEHSGHRIETITGSKGSGPVLTFVFGREDAQIAIRAGREVSTLPSDVAQRRLLAAAASRYPGHEFFIHCFMNVAADAYNSTK